MTTQTIPDSGLKGGQAAQAAGRATAPHAGMHLPEVLRAARLLLVSPHFDDVVLSCEALVGSGRQADVLTVFTGAPEDAGTSAWDRRCGFDTAAQATAGRDAEDRAAFDGTPHLLHRLGLLDAQYVPSAGRAGRDVEAVTDWADQWLEAAPGPSVVLLPAGAGASRPSQGPRAAAAWLLRAVGRRIAAAGRKPAGGAQTNPDHVWVRDVLARHLAARGVRVVLYEEFPYLLGQPADRAAEGLARHVGAEVEAFDIPVDRQAKLARISAYRSQLPHLLPGRCLESALPASERYWLLTPRR